MDIAKLTEDIQKETEKIIVGKSDKIKLILMAILAGGHVLIEDLPGVGKTTLVKTMAIALGCSSGRVQFVPDLLPSDILGMNIFNQKTGEFELRQGPLMVNILLADEINRAIPRTQSALLEAMEERQISIDGEKIRLPEPFVVLATQNPIESESTFKLPAAQMDRFLIRINMGYPEMTEEIKMLKSTGDGIPFEKVEAVTDRKRLMEAIRQVDAVHVADEVLEYIIRIAGATRNDPELKMGASPRAAKALYRASKVWATMNGRDFVTPDDVKELAVPVLAHRLIFRSGTGKGASADMKIQEILGSVDASITLDHAANDKKTNEE